MKASIYVRFSDRRDSEHCQSNEMQLEICRKYCENHGYEIAGEFADDAVSGAEEDRPVLWNAIASLKRGMVLVVYRADRLARNVYLHELIYRSVRKRKATIEVVDGGRNGDTAEDELLRTVMAAFSAYERRVIAARTKAAALRLQARNVAVSSVPPFGKRAAEAVETTKNGQAWSQRMWEDDPAELRVIGEIRHMRLAGLGLREIARALNIKGERIRGREWNHVAVKRILEREERTQPC